MKGARRICGVVGGGCGGRPDTPPPPPRLTSPHGGSVAPQERRRSSNFKYVLTRNQKVAYHNGGKNPHFRCDHLLDPKVNGGGAAETGGEGQVGWGGQTHQDILFALSLTSPTRRYGSSFHILRHRFSRERLKLWSLHIWAAWKATNDQWGFPRRFAGFLSASRFFLPSRRPTGRGLLLFNLRLQECRGFDGFTVASLTNGCPGNCVESDYGAVLKGFHSGDFFIPQTLPVERESADGANQSEYLQSGLFCRATKLFCVE